MANQGTVTVIPSRPYDNYESLKRYLDAERGVYGPEVNEIITHHIKLTTGATAIEVEGLGTTGVTAISQIARTEVTIELTAAGDHATHDGKIFSLTWENAAGDEFTSTATGTTDLASTPVAYANPVATSVYKVTAFTVNADFTTQDVISKVNAGKTYATISAAGTTLAATEAQLFGFGDVYVRMVSNHASGLAKVMFFEYLSGSGVIRWGHGSTDGADSSVEKRAYEAMNNGNGTTSATSIPIKDFYRIRWAHTAATVDTDTDEFLLCGSNSNGTTTEIYGLIDLGDFEHTFTRYCCPAGYDAWIAVWHVHGAPKVVGATSDTFNFEVNYTDRLWDYNRKMIHVFEGHQDEEIPILLKELSDASFLVSDNDGAQILTVDITIVEAKRR